VKTKPPKPSTNAQGKIEGETSLEGPQSKSAGVLFVVATPIGNMGDITLRAIETLRAADRVICEDSRVTGGLLNRLGFKRPLLPYHDHNADDVRPRILAHLRAGEKLALVSDAGTPLVSDPGCKLVREALAEGIAVTALPGASALLTGLVLSGLPSDRFLFAGFLPSKQGQRQKAIAELKTVPATLIFYESPNRLGDSLADLAAGLGDRSACVARELTKLFEEVRRGSLSELAGYYNQVAAPKGEVVLVIGPPVALASDLNQLETLLHNALETMSVRDAAESVAQATGRPKREVYNLALAMGKKHDGA
jgi:16S rRNA (cytidine1402-2'-O)-methyltransferase